MTAQPLITDQLATLHQLLAATGTQYRVFDLGRRVQPISQADFEAFENATLGYPFPLQQKAWLAILFWDSQQDQTCSKPFLWFLHFPLDEQGKLIQATRNHFIAMVIEVLGNQLTGDTTETEQLNNNPYTFTPDQTKLALLNALIRSQLGAKTSPYYEHAYSYLQGTLGWQQWHSVGLQGLADFVVRLAVDDHLAIVSAALPHLPAEVETPLFSLLEHIDLDRSLMTALTASATTALETMNKQALINHLRAISGSHAADLRQPLLKRILTSPLATDRDILLVITARCWLDLQDDNLRSAFLENLASVSPDQQLFQGVIADLVAIPAVRPHFLRSFRSTERSVTLAKAIGYLFNPQHQ